MTLVDQMTAAKSASYKLGAVNLDLRNKALEAVAAAMLSQKEKILNANKLDIDAAGKNGLSYVMKKRLLFSDDKINGLLAGINDLIKAEDPLAIVDLKRELDSGLQLFRKRVPIGVIGVIFESRPDALVQISSLCIKSGNVVVLKGGKEAVHSNRALFEVINSALSSVDPVFENTVLLVETRDEIKQMLTMDDYIDLMIPRGSNELVKFIQGNTRIPVLGHADGICHLYIDKDADLSMAVDLTYDSKCQYPAVCNALETLLVHQDAAEEVLPRIKEKLKDVELRGDEKVLKIISANKADDTDWDTEYTDMILSIKIVSNLEEAIEFINKHSSHHTDSIITKNNNSAEIFIQSVDSSSVMHNCSTRFADGFRYGFGAEVGVSTNKIHARGPVGMEGLTIYKYILKGSGQSVAPYAEGIKKFSHKDLK